MRGLPKTGSPIISLMTILSSESNNDGDDQGLPDDIKPDATIFLLFYAPFTEVLIGMCSRYWKSVEGSSTLDLTSHRPDLSQRSAYAKPNISRRVKAKALGGKHPLGPKNRLVAQKSCSSQRLRLDGIVKTVTDSGCQKRWAGGQCSCSWWWICKCSSKGRHRSYDDPTAELVGRPSVDRLGPLLSPVPQNSTFQRLQFFHKN